MSSSRKIGRKYVRKFLKTRPRKKPFKPDLDGLVVVGRGVSRGSTETEPLAPASCDDPFSNFFSIYRDEIISKDQTTPVTSGRSSPTELYRASNCGWATGNTTERSSLYSSYSWADDISWGDEYDRRASSNVRSLFEEIDSVLFAESSQTSSTQSSARSTHLQKECQEWMSQFPHLRVSGVKMTPQQDLGFQVIPVEKPPSQNDLLLDLAETTHTPSSQDTQSLMITGKHMVVKHAPRPLSTADGNDPSPSDPYAFLHDEVFAQDGYYEEIIALDYKTEDEIVSARNPRRAARRGLPPLTPNACVRDSVVSMTFDMAWSEIVSWMRDIIRLYLEYILSDNSKHPVPPLEITDASLSENQLQALPLESIGAPLTRDNSFAKSERRVPTAQSYFAGQSTQALAGVLTISTKALLSREKSNLQDVVEPQSSRDIVRPGSSLNRLVHANRPSSVKASDQQTINRLSSARKGPARVRLAPLDRAKTPNIEEDHRKDIGNQILFGRGFSRFSERQQQQTNNDRILSPSYMIRSALPPIRLVESGESISTSSPQRHQRNLKSHLTTRASSALAEKDIRLPRERERSLIMPLDNRPSTTHTFRSDTPFAVSRRSSTPMGFSAARGTLQSSNYVSSGGVSTLLKIAGNSIGNSHSHDVPLSHHQLDEGDEETFHDLQHAHWGSSGNSGTSLPIRRGRQIELSSVVR